MARSNTPGAVPPLSSRLTVLALGFLGLVVVLLVWVVVPTGGHAQPNRPRHVSTGLRARSDVPAALSQHTPAALGGGAGLTAAPSDVTWGLFDSVALPYSTSAGPGSVTTDGAVSGFAHDPEGALIAVVQIAVRHLLARNWQAVTGADVAAGPGRSAYVALRQEVERTGTMPVVPGHYMQVAGFSFVAYSPKSASINVVSRSTAGAYQVVTETVVWQRDWKLQLTSDGSAAPAAVSVSSLAGYIVWGGVS